MKTVYIISLLFPILFIIPRHSKTEQSFRIKGIVTDSIHNEPVPFACARLFINDTIRGFGISDLDGRFIIADSELITDKNDKLSLRVDFVNGIYKEVVLNSDSLNYIRISLCIKEKISVSQIKIWRDAFIEQNKLDKWFYCNE